MCRLDGFATGSVDSLSCLHTIEHVGLGRYGDPVDPEGWVVAVRELARILAPGGRLYLGTPIGRERVCFNSERVFSPKTILEALSGSAARQPRRHRRGTIGSCPTPISTRMLSPPVWMWALRVDQAVTRRTAAERSGRRRPWRGGTGRRRTASCTSAITSSSRARSFPDRRTARSAARAAGRLPHGHPSQPDGLARGGRGGGPDADGRAAGSDRARRRLRHLEGSRASSSPPPTRSRRSRRRSASSRSSAITTTTATCRRRWRPRASRCCATRARA